MSLNLRACLRSIRSENGQSLVEIAITFNLLMGFIFVRVELCLVFYSYGMISESAREGTRYAIMHGATCVSSSSTSCTASAAAISTYVRGLGWPNAGGGTVTPTVTFPDGNQSPGSRVHIAITYVFPVRIPMVPRNSLSMTTSSEMYILQ